MEFRIRPAAPEDAAFIAETVLGAIGEAHIRHMAGSEERIPLVKELFTNLAGIAKSQYSYLNSLIAETPQGEKAGAIICYDGANLYGLRQSFIDEANRLLGWGIRQEDFDPETSPDEIYLDSLMVRPEFRRQGLGGLLISRAKEKAREAGKPLGLLCDFDNRNARKLYSGLGFKSVGRRPFAGKMMEHLQLL